MPRNRTISFLLVKPLRTQTAKALRSFLGHAFPTVRAACAETVYVKSQTSDVVDDEEAEEGGFEEALLETPWYVNICLP